MGFDLGRYGVWGGATVVDGAFAAEVEALGYTTLSLGGSPDGHLEDVEQLLEATTSLKVVTSIVNVWKDPAEIVAASFRRIEWAHPGRFLLGIGIGHPEATAQYGSPFATLVAYLDVLESHGVPRDQIAVAALGPRVLRLSGQRSAGALPYLVTPEHTRQAREILGAGVLLAPEQKVVVADAGGPTETTRAIARPPVASPYLGLVNYRRNLERLGWTEADLADGGSDELIDALVVQGSPDAVAAGVDAHLDAGAEHVAIQALGPDPLAGLRALAPVLGLGASGRPDAP